MPNYNDAQGVADLLSQFDFNIINEGPGDFSTQHRKYTCEFSKPGIESFTTTYQSNPDVHGQPTATDVFAALASDALAVDGLFVDTFADELGFEKPSQAIRAYESCHKTLDWLKNDMQLTTSEISDIAETLDNELEGLKEAGVYALADDVYDDVFDGITIDFDDNNMDIEDFASEAQNAIHDAMDEPLYDALGSNDGILEDGELSGDFEAIKESGYDFPNPCAMSIEAVRTVNEKGYEAAFNEFWKGFMPEDHELAASQDVTLIPVTLHFNETPDKSESMTFSAQDTNGLDIDDKVFFSGLTHEELTGMVGEQTGEDFTIESVGEPYQVEAHPKSQEPSQPRLAEKAKETRDGSGKLEQDSHDGQTPEREDERADGDAEH